MGRRSLHKLAIIQKAILIDHKIESQAFYTFYCPVFSVYFWIATVHNYFVIFKKIFSFCVQAKISSFFYSLENCLQISESKLIFLALCCDIFTYCSQLKFRFSGNRDD